MVIIDSKSKLNQIKHRLTHSEISNGNIFFTKGDGVLDFFRQFSEPFTIVTKWEKLYARRAGKQAVWMGYEIMRKFNPYDVIKISKKGKTVYIEK